MQIIEHKNLSLTISQKFFIEKSIELLNIGTIDSYRVKLHNPRTILEELKYCLDEFEMGRIKHFQTIKGKDKNSKGLINEALKFLEIENNGLIFSTVTIEFLKNILHSIDENNYKKVSASLEILLNENQQYLSKIITITEDKLNINIDNSNLESLFKHLSMIDKIIEFLFSELINKGFSKGFLYKLCYGIFVKNRNNENFDTLFSNFKQRILDIESKHTVIFRIDTTPSVSQELKSFSIRGVFIDVSDSIDSNIQQQLRRKQGFDKFKDKVPNRRFIMCTVDSFDYLSALKKAKNAFSEYLDVVNLGFSDEFLHIHNKVLVIDNRSPERADFQENINILDGKYKPEKDRYNHFIGKLPHILENDKVQRETKEKVKSAIRYLRLGNQSTEMEHKFINYWIGLEYLFSNYESQNTIGRIKDFFIKAHCLAYIKRNITILKKEIESVLYLKNLSINIEDETSYDAIINQSVKENPLLSFRVNKIKEVLFKDRNIKQYIDNHKENLEIHFIRIYRLRNEIIHDAAMNTNNELISSNMRYYLTFILNEIIDFLSNNTDNKELSIEKYFILNEIKYENLETQKFPLKEMVNINCSIDFIS
ncbi:hypothetical protein [Capnocytophaga canis]|uniref:hypothetical protein n=1 Tax=Capnocytophaga canis TaxID=1848903 RepID=UPI0037CFB1A8